MLDLRVLAPPAELRSLVADRFASLAALPDAEFSCARPSPQQKQQQQKQQQKKQQKKQQQ